MNDTDTTKLEGMIERLADKVSAQGAQIQSISDDVVALRKLIAGNGDHGLVTTIALLQLDLDVMKQNATARGDKIDRACAKLEELEDTVEAFRNRVIGAIAVVSLISSAVGAAIGYFVLTP